MRVRGRCYDGYIQRMTPLLKKDPPYPDLQVDRDGGRHGRKRSAMVVLHRGNPIMRGRR